MSCEPVSYGILFELRKIVSLYIFPTVTLFGIAGNALNLVVMNVKGMRTKTNYFLSAMALTDMGFLLFMIPHNLVMIPNAITWGTVFSLCMKYRMWFNTIVNSMSRAEFLLTRHFLVSLYVFEVLSLNLTLKRKCSYNFHLSNNTLMQFFRFAIAVTAERLVAIIFPIHAKAFLRMWHLKLISAVIAIWSLGINLYNLFWMVPVQAERFVCNQTVLTWRLEQLNKSDNPAMYNYVQLSLAVVPYVSVVTPLIMLVILNSLLLRYLHIGRSGITSNGSHSKLVEFRITLMVVLIIASFIVFQTPSAFLYIWEAVSSKPYPVWFFTVTTISNLLVSFGKALNFVLYCVISSNFRRRLIKILFQTIQSLTLAVFYLSVHLKFDRSNCSSVMRIKRFIRTSQVRLFT
ncbi:unnamed protein product [Soboliphyme baturini]|uniref:G_PROTEIN_RECEP_F1_2 domain-containing protein n=1 Tax=Soboliphyme baturini TaxID=241478 RepID=A0A183J2G1_9BILA|nr:unnamed protein product [Soboliphyme baturini]